MRLKLMADSAEGVSYLLKDRVRDAHSLTNAVRQVATGGSALDPEVVSQMLQRPRDRGPLDRQSERERSARRSRASPRSADRASRWDVMGGRRSEAPVRSAAGAGERRPQR